MLFANFNTDQKVSVVVKPVSAKGKPALLVDTPAWVSSDLNVVEPVVAEGGLTGDFLGVNVGVATVTISGTNALGVVISESVECTVVAAPADALNLEIGEPVLQ